MTFISFGFIAEVGPYYGTLDEVYRLMKRAWTKTNRMWDQIKTQLQKIVFRRKCTTFGETLLKDIQDEDYLKLITETFQVYTLYKLSYWRIADKEEYDAMWAFLEKAKNPEMIQFDQMWFQIYKDRQIQHDSSTNSLGTVQLQDPFIAEYNKLISLMKKLGMSFDRVNSYCYVEDIPYLINLEYIRSIIFSWTPENSNQTLIDAWESSKKLFNTEFERLVLVWKRDETDSLIDLLNTLKESKISIKLSNKLRIKFYTTMKSMNIREDQVISVYFWSQEHNLFFEMEHKKQRKRSDQIVEISFENWKMTSFIKNTNDYLVALNMTIFSKPPELIFKDSESLILQPNFDLLWFDLKKFSQDYLTDNCELNKNIIPANFNKFKLSNIKSVRYNTDVNKDWVPSLTMIPSRTWNLNRDLSKNTIAVSISSTTAEKLYNIRIKFNEKADVSQISKFINRLGNVYFWRNIVIIGVYSSQISKILESQNASLTLKVFRFEMEEPLSFLDRFKWMKAISKYQNKNIKFYITEKNNKKAKIVFKA